MIEIYDHMGIVNTPASVFESCSKRNNYNDCTAFRLYAFQQESC